MQTPTRLHKFLSLSILQSLPRTLIAVCLVLISLIILKLGFSAPTYSSLFPSIFRGTIPSTLSKNLPFPCGRAWSDNGTTSFSSTVHPAYPNPVGGSFTELEIETSWVSSTSRFNKYHLPENESRTLDWSAIQASCSTWKSLQFDATRRLDQYRCEGGTCGNTNDNGTRTQPFRHHQTRRTAIVLRTWEGYEYHEQDLANIRALIAETALGSQGAYSVFLLVDVKDESRQIFRTSRNYGQALDEVVPAEFRNISVLFDRPFLERSYPKISDHSSYYQIFQPLQLFAQTYDEFDHYWQLEVDVRVTGNWLEYLQKSSNFCRKEPQKQCFERASYRFMPDIHGNYRDFLSTINNTLEGRGIWGPVSVPEVAHPIAEPSPHASPLMDNFEWGTDWEADFIATVPCKPLPATTSWLFRDWGMSSFVDGNETPRMFCPHATSRVSWNLLNAVHTAQVEQGLALPSEATMPSFAMWHGLKICHPPQPWFIEHPYDLKTLHEIINGPWPPSAEHKGFSFGTSSYDDNVLWKLNWDTEQTWWWRSDRAKEIWDSWYESRCATDQSPHVRGDDQSGSLLGQLLQCVEGVAYVPKIALHPVKTNLDP